MIHITGSNRSTLSSLMSNNTGIQTTMIQEANPTKDEY